MDPRDVADLIEGKQQVSERMVNPGETNMPEIKGDNVEDAMPGEGRIFYDIRFRAWAPDKEELIQLIIDVEAQRRYHPGYDLMSVVMICLSGELAKAENKSTRLHRLLGTLLSSEMTRQKKKDIIETEYGIPMTESMERRVNIMCNLSDTIEERGISKGIEQGEAKRLIENIMSLQKKLNLNAEEACKLLDVSYEQYQEALKLIVG